MDLLQIIRFVQKNKIRIVIGGFLFAIFGFVLWAFLPKEKIVSGSFYVSRLTQNISEIKVNPLNAQGTFQNYFAYEGYYAQQTASQYTPTFISLVESDDVLKAVLLKTSKPITERNLRFLRRAITVKKKSAQFVEISVKTRTGVSLLSAELIWDILAAELDNTHNEIVRSTDPYLMLSRVNIIPVVREGYTSLYLNIFAGFFIGMFVSAFYFVFSEYVKKK